MLNNKDKYKLLSIPLFIVAALTACPLSDVFLVGRWGAMILLWATAVLSWVVLVIIGRAIYQSYQHQLPIILPNSMIWMLAFIPILLLPIMQMYTVLTAHSQIFTQTYPDELFSAFLFNISLILTGPLYWLVEGHKQPTKS